MSRHSKNNSSNGVFTYMEKKMLKGIWGSKDARIGLDSQKAFDQCNLCLTTVNEPMCCEKGILNR
jgi:nitric oxide synthase-interacting protein